MILLQHSDLTIWELQGQNLMKSLVGVQVSWIRKRDLHILTFGQLSYTNDARFSVVKSAGGDTWTLRIRSTQLRDAGMYECQVSSEPKISRAVRLKVVGKYAPRHAPESHLPTPINDCRQLHLLSFSLYLSLSLIDRLLSFVLVPISIWSFLFLSQRS